MLENAIEYLGSDPKLFASHVGSGSETERKMGSRFEKNSFGSTTLLIIEMQG
jgi:hypothetical protein